MMRFGPWIGRGLGCFGWARMIGGGVATLLFWAAIILLIVLAVRAWRRRTGPMAPATPLELLKARYARGEISKEQYDQIRHDIEG